MGEAAAARLSAPAVAAKKYCRGRLLWVGDGRGPPCPPRRNHVVHKSLGRSGGCGLILGIMGKNPAAECAEMGGEGILFPPSSSWGMKGFHSHHKESGAPSLAASNNLLHSDLVCRDECALLSRNFPPFVIVVDSRLRFGLGKGATTKMFVVAAMLLLIWYSWRYAVFSFSLPLNIVGSVLPFPFPSLLHPLPQWRQWLSKRRPIPRA